MGVLNDDGMRATELVTSWLVAAEQLESAAGRRLKGQRARLRTVITDPSTADLTMALTDEVLRIPSHRVAARQFARVVSQADVGKLPLADRLLLEVGAVLAPRIPEVVMPLVTKRLKRETSATIIAAVPAKLANHRAMRERLGYAININALGEANLGDEEATRRRAEVLRIIETGASSSVSVKLSSLVANLSALAFDATVERSVKLLTPLYLAALRHNVFVNLDMEEYRDLSITCAVFRSVLEDRRLANYTGGIVLQAYLPDAHRAAEELGSWARQRVMRGGAPIRIRLVKGANLAMELVDAEMHGWNPATYATKHEVDASWKRLFERLIDPVFDHSITVSVASHNLFDVAWAVAQRDDLFSRGMSHRVRFEMLEGMAESQARAVLDTTGDLLMYTPVVAEADFVAAIGYLTRRLDENTGPDNFLRALVDLTPHSEEFRRQQRRFVDALQHRHTVSTDSFRAAARESRPSSAFCNAPDTDFTQLRERESLLNAVRHFESPTLVPVITATEEIDEVLRLARNGAEIFSEWTHHQRAELLGSVAKTVSLRRFETIALMAHHANKTFPEGDTEVSEAIDFANYYAQRADELARHGESSEPLGVVVVAPPWNFPYAITLGGVLAALAAGNSVVLKPTPQCPEIAIQVASDCWDAGVPRAALSLARVPDDDIGRHLITHDGVNAVILTGSFDTAQMFLAWKPSLRLLAETSGKNSMIITSTADLDLAIKDLVKSAFGHAGQKCSAASLAIVEGPVFDDPSFRRRLADAVRTLRCGPATDPTTDIAPLMETPNAALKRGLTELDSGESWLVSPVNWDPADERAWSPGVRLSVAEGSWFHQSELFGPVLGVMRADDLDHALRLQNGVRFGLTAGLHALAEHEVQHWVERVEAGNLYVNRTITGAIVQRQPFGGWKQSAVGPGAKAGGPSYVRVLRRWKAGCSLERLGGIGQMSREVSDPSDLRSESNTLRYRPLPRGVLVVIGRDTAALQRELAELASTSTTTPIEVVEGDEVEAIRLLQSQRFDRVRLLGDHTPGLRTLIHELGLRLDDDPMSDDPTIELVRFTREQVVTVTQHRHGRPHRVQPFAEPVS